MSDVLNQCPSYSTSHLSIRSSSIICSNCSRCYWWWWNEQNKQTKPNPPPSRPRSYWWYYRASHPWHEWIFQEFYHFSILNLFVTACYLWQFSMDYQEENVRRNENIHPCNGMGLKLVFCELTQPTVMTRALLFTETILEIWSVKYVIQLFQFDPKDWIGIRSRYLYLYTCSWLYSQQNTWYV